MTRPVGYYVHHHGDGHRQRAIQIASRAPGRFVLLGTGLRGRTEGLECIDLPDDRPLRAEGFDGFDAAASRPDALHYAPYDHDGVRERVARVTGWIAEARPALMVVDVSAEIAMLTRLAATPTVYVRQNGKRDDPAHLDAFRGARALLCPFSEALDDPETPGWVRDKTVYWPGLTAVPGSRAVWADVVLVVVGKGGSAADGERIAATARAHPELRWRIAGPVSTIAEPPSNLTVLGWSDDMSDEIAAAGLVVGGAGNGLVNAVLATSRPFICLPEPRPFDEQVVTACRLEALGAAVCHDGWPSAEAWPHLRDRALRLDPGSRTGLSDPNGPAAAARWLVALADGGEVTTDPAAQIEIEEMSA